MMATPFSPERRSAADLQRVLEGLLGDGGSVLSRDIPDVLSQYETKHDLVIVDPSEYDGLRGLCTQYPDLELGPKELFSFLSMVPKPQKDAKPSRTNEPHLPHSSSLPPTAFRDAATTPVDKIKKPNRRASDRIRSPSDSSSSDSGSDNGDAKDENAAHRASLPVNGKVGKAISSPSSRAFPAGDHALQTPSNIPRPINRRTKTLSDPSRLDSPLAMRVRATGAGAGTFSQPPSAYGNFGAFARPSPASRRRRGSAGAQSDGRASPSPDVAGGPGPGGIRKRTTSGGSSICATSPPWGGSQGSQPASPLSPMYGIGSGGGLDSTSLHRAKSPEEVDEEYELDGEGEDYMMQVEGVDEEIDGMEDEAGDQAGDLRNMGNDSLNPRLSRISTESTTSLRTSHDKLQALQKQNTELARKLKESERQLTVLGAENERLVEDLQEKLEEARADIAQRRKDEKEYKSKERAQNIQISGFEGEIQSLQRSLENSKANHANMQKMYNSQCDEAQRLRDMIRERDTEIEQLESSTQAHEADEEKFTREVHVLEAEIKRLEEDLSVARQAESHLEVQKQENLQLKETIDRVRFDLDEARAAAANATGGHTRGATGSSGPATLSRNLGDELNRRLMDAEKVREAAEEDDGSFVETIVTTQRVRKLGTRTKSQSQSDGPNIPIIRLEEEIKEYADASTETDTELDQVESVAGPSATTPGPGNESSYLPPAYTAEPIPVNAQQVLDHAHPRDRAHLGEELDAGYDALVKDIGVRCIVLEEELKLHHVARSKSGRGSASGTVTKSFSERRKLYSRGNIVNYIFYPNDISSEVGRYAVFGVALFAVGLIFGSHISSPPAGLARDMALYKQMNTLAYSAGGVGEGFLPFGQGVLGVVETGARLVAGRIPT